MQEGLFKDYTSYSTYTKTRQKFVVKSNPALSLKPRPPPVFAIAKKSKVVQHVPADNCHIDVTARKRVVNIHSTRQSDGTTNSTNL